MALEAGAEAPDFTLTSRIGQDPVSLADTLSRGPVVLLFFPLAFSSVCTDEMCQLAEDHRRWEQLGAEIIGVSVDSPFVNAKFADETGVSFPLLSDFNREVMTAYGVRNDDYFGMRGVADRSAFVIGQDRTIRYSWSDADSSVLPPFDEIAEALRALG